MLGREVVVVSSSTESTIGVWDLHTGTFLTAYKQNASLRNGLAVLGQSYMVAAQATKTCLNFWSWHKDAVLQRSFTLEQIKALATTPDGAHCVGGGDSGALYVWETGSGRLLRSWPAHYKAASALAFDGSGAVLLSGGEDTAVNAWLLADVLDAGAGADPSLGDAPAGPRPLQSWSDHTLPVTGVACGVAVGGAGLAVSCSLDRTCNLYSLAQGLLLRTVALCASLHALALDPGEHALYAGGGDGRIFEVSLVDGAVEPVALEGHTRTVTCLALASDAQQLVSGSDDGSVRVWDLPSRQPTRVIQAPAKAPVSAVLVVPHPPGLAGAGGGGRGVEHKPHGHKALAPVQPLAPFCKYAGMPGAAKQWEGTPVLLSGAAPYAGIVAEAGLLTTEPPTPSAAQEESMPDAAPDGGGDKAAATNAEEGERLRKENAELQARLQEALAAASQWQQLHSQVHSLALRQHLSQNGSQM